MSSERVTYVDLAKIIAIICVVIGHFSPDYQPVWWKVCNRAIYSFHMPLFIFLSGFLYVRYSLGKKYGALLLSKLQRIMIPYLSASIVIIVIKLLTQSFFSVANPVTAKAFFEMFYYPSAGYFLWFLWALMWFFIIVGVLRNRIAHLVLFGASAVLYFLPVIFVDWFCLNQVKVYFVYFMTGCVVADEWFDRDSLIKRVPVVVALLFWIASMYIYFKFDLEVSWYVLILGIIGTLAMLSLCYWIQGKFGRHLVSTITLLASSVFTIYLFHTTFEGFAKAVLDRLPFIDVTNNLHFIFIAISVVMAGLLLPYALHRLFGMNKVSRFLFAVRK